MSEKEGKAMKYDFDIEADRRGSNSLKWDVAENELPMWVADMDFRTAPQITAALEKRAAHGVFGYSIVPDEWYKAYADWWKNRHGLDIEKQRLIFCTGVVPAISSLVRKLTTPAEKVLIQTPVYNISTIQFSTTAEMFLNRRLSMRTAGIRSTGTTLRISLPIRRQR